MSEQRSASTRSGPLHWLGPGLLLAGAAVGVSHLVQATRAGAEFGLLLAPLVLLVCTLKMPFLSFGPLYAAATGRSLLDGYRRVGTWALSAYTLITLGTMVIILAVVTLVTAGLAGLVFGLALPIWALAALVLAACALLLVVGRFRGLDLGMKLIMAVLAVSTLASAALAFGHAPGLIVVSGVIEYQRVASAAGISFLLALMGWMPIPLDVAAWHSLWTLEKQRTSRESSARRAREAGVDFQIGFWLATVLALLFLLIGALMLYATGNPLPDSAVGFAGALVGVYAQTLGEWARPFIAIAALTTMFSTTLAVLDAFPRVLVGLQHEWTLWSTLRRAAANASKALPEHTAEAIPEARARAIYRLWLTILALAAIALIAAAGARFTVFVDFATTVSFLATPILAWITYRAVLLPAVPAELQPGIAMRALAWAGIAFTTLFAVGWLGWRLSNWIA